MTATQCLNEALSRHSEAFANLLDTTQRASL